MHARNIKEREYGYTDSLDSLIVSLCRDYERREASVRDGRCTGRTAMEYKYINHKISEGAIEIAGERYGRVFIDEIGSRTGFAYSSVDCLGETSYKLLKQDVKLNIAKKLHLID
ncbi:MAG: hypothetical protein IJW48_03045 [Clostridia bacterium]|nr:hypothetical protein [Clostridia bacterium]